MTRSPEPALPQDTLEQLVEAARQASTHAYCPYSGFAVGAAVLTSDGRVFVGCNVENASYGLTVCAERNAVAQMVAGGGREIVAAAAYARSEVAPRPCGACLQVLSEFGPDARVVAVCEGADRLDATVPDLLPDPFRPSSLEER